VPKRHPSPAPPACILVAVLLLGGCQTTFDLVGVAIPLSTEESHHYDGSYQGTVELVTDADPTCRAGEPERVVMVGDGVLWYAYGPATLFSLPIAYDGTLGGKSGDATLTGRITGNHLEAVIKSPSGIIGKRLAVAIKSPPCEAVLSMDYIYNHS